MEKSLFEQMGGTYTQVGDYMSPDLLPDTKSPFARTTRSADRSMGAATRKIFKTAP